MSSLNLVQDLLRSLKQQQPSSWRKTTNLSGVLNSMDMRVKELIQQCAGKIKSLEENLLIFNQAIGASSGGTMTGGENDHSLENKKSNVDGEDSQDSQNWWNWVKSKTGAGAQFKFRLLNPSAKNDEIRVNHRKAMLWWLQNKLAGLSSSLQEYREAKLKLELEKQKNLGISPDSQIHISPISINRDLNQQQEEQQEEEEEEDEDDFGEKPPAKKTKQPLPPSASKKQQLFQVDLPLEPEELQLSDQQRQMLELENASLLQEFESKITEIRRAETQLMEISELQNQLGQHLTEQMEKTEFLFTEAQSTADQIRSGNEQLKEAGKTNAETRKWILLLFILAAVVLLFLDWYD